MLATGFIYAVPMGNRLAFGLVRRIMNLRGWWKMTHEGWRPWEEETGDADQRSGE
jgi:hypothetical protein